MSDTTYKSPLHETVSAYPTDFWNDSCSVAELEYAIEHGAVGATSNPTIVEQVLKQERHLWEDRIYELIADNPTWSDEDVMSQIFEEIALKGAELRSTPIGAPWVKARSLKLWTGHEASLHRTRGRRDRDQANAV